jgi:hypothetical protein
MERKGRGEQGVQPKFYRIIFIAPLQGIDLQ